MSETQPILGTLTLHFKRRRHVRLITYFLIKHPEYLGVFVLLQAEYRWIVPFLVGVGFNALPFACQRLGSHGAHQQKG
jgi:protein-S-isoprenylcysteine O-methyltransferase Ste14